MSTALNSSVFVASLVAAIATAARQGLTAQFHRTARVGPTLTVLVVTIAGGCTAATPPPDDIVAPALLEASQPQKSRFAPVAMLEELEVAEKVLDGVVEAHLVELPFLLEVAGKILPEAVVEEL